MSRIAARLARRWPGGAAHLVVRDATAAAALRQVPPGTVVEAAATVPKDSWFVLADAALGAGGWLALPADGLGDLGRARGTAGPSGRVLLLAPTRTAWGGALRALDVCLSVALLVTLSPMLVLIGLGVRLSSRGPVLYRAKVVGRGERPFVWYKFRTMREGGSASEENRKQAFAAFVRGERAGAPDVKVVEQSRVTPFGAWLRRHSVDELPQLWNVLVGRMALVGPRPCLPYEAQFYADWRARRFEVKPGLTGLWQVYGRSRVGFEEAAVMDALHGYLKSLRLDLWLITRTVWVVVRGTGGR